MSPFYSILALFCHFFLFAPFVNASRVSTLTPGNTCLFTLPHNRYNLSVHGLHGSYYIESDCLYLKRNPEYECTDLLNLTSFRKRSKNEDRVSIFWVVDFVAPRNDEVFLVNPVIGKLNHKSKSDGSQVKRLSILPREDIYLAVVEPELNENPFVLAKTTVNEVNYWTIKLLDQEIVECGKTYIFQIRAIKTNTGNYIDAAEVLIDAEQSFCRKRAESIEKLRHFEKLIEVEKSKEFERIIKAERALEDKISQDFVRFLEMKRLMQFERQMAQMSAIEKQLEAKRSDQGDRVRRQVSALRSTSIKFTVREGEFVNVNLLDELDLPTSGRSYT